MTIAVKLDELLHDRRMTLTELAERIDITLANLSILKTGKARAIRFSTLEAICETLACQPGDVLEFVPAPSGRRAARGECEEERASMTLLLWVHIASGLIAADRRLHCRRRAQGRAACMARPEPCSSARCWSLASRAAILEPFREPEPGSPVGPLLVCYFVGTSWVTARRRDGTTGRFEVIACAVALGAAAIIAWSGLTGELDSPGGPRSPSLPSPRSACWPAWAISMSCCARGCPAAQRISRHLWRMCFAFFVAAGSFFLGQQDIMPEAVRGSPILFVLAFAPLAIMLFWLVRLRFAKAVGRLALRVRPAPTSPAVAS